MKDIKMGKRMTSKRMIVAGVVIVLALSFILPISFSPWTPVAFYLMGHQAKRMRERILCKTDHQALLEACREVLNQGDLDPGRKYKVRNAQHDPEVSQFPKPILDLAPNYLLIEDIAGNLRLEMHGGTDHFGVRAYPKDFRKPFPSYEYADKELIPGLWYYDDGYNHNPEYDKKIDDLIQKYK